MAVLDMDALHRAIADARETERAAFDAMWAAMRASNGAEYDAALDDWRRASVRHQTLIESGLILTLGTGDDDGPRED